jgi:hypothetical protein
VVSLVQPRWEGAPPRWFPTEFGWVVGCSYTGLPTTTGEVRNPIGAGMSFRRAPAVAAGGFSTAVGRVGTRPVGCEETELSIRLTRMQTGSRILHEPRAVVHHHVPHTRARFSYFVRRCWSEGQSKAEVSRLTDQRHALSTERAYVRSTLPAGALQALGAWTRTAQPRHLARAGAIGAGLAVTAAGYVTTRVGHGAGHANRKDKEMSPDTAAAPSPNSTAPNPTYLNFDVHGRVGLRVAADSAAALQLKTMFAAFATDAGVADDIVVDAVPERLLEAAALEDELAYTEDAVSFLRQGVQIVREAGRYRIHGAGELLTTVVPVLDRAMVSHGAAMIHAATVGYRGHAVALPAAGGTGKTSTVAKLMRRDGFSFMGDDWAFLAEDGALLGYEKPMFIKPHHRPIFPHLFTGVRRPMVPVALSRPVGRLTTVVHPYVVRFPKLADVSRRWSPEHRMVRAADALPGVEVTRAAPLLLSVYVERFDGHRSRLVERKLEWMVDRMLGNFHIEMAGFSQEVVAALGATSVVPLRQHVEEKATVLTKALDGRPCYLLQVPSRYSADEASDDVVRFLDDLLPGLVNDADPAKPAAVRRSQEA